MYTLFKMFVYYEWPTMVWDGGKEDVDLFWKPITKKIETEYLEDSIIFLFVFFQQLGISLYCLLDLNNAKLHLNWFAISFGVYSIC